MYLPYIRPIFQGYVRRYTRNIWPYVVQYFHFRILEFPSIYDFWDEGVVNISAASGAIPGARKLKPDLTLGVRAVVFDVLRFREFWWRNINIYIYQI